MKYVLMGFLLFFIVGCSNTKQIEQRLDKVVIYNHTNYEITNATIYANSTKRKMQCSNIPKNSYCEYAFKRNKNTKNSFKIQWSYNNQTYSRKDINIENIKIEDEGSLVIYLNLLENGKFSLSE